MSNFTYEEICNNCRFANWHECDMCTNGDHFCHCGIKKEDETDKIHTGRCPSKVLKKKKHYEE